MPAYISTSQITANARPGNPACLLATAKSQAAVFLTSQEARGGTNLSPAVSAAYQHADTARPLNVIILSDGLAEQG